MSEQRSNEELRARLRKLHEQAGAPTADSLKKHADRRGHDVSRAALAAVPRGSGGMRWGTVEAFIEACASYAQNQRQQLPDEAVNMLAWRERFDRWYSGERSGHSTRPQRVGAVPRLADGFQTRAVAQELAAKSNSTAVLAAEPWLLSGLGGVGKTQLAVHFAERLWQERLVDLLVWISGTSRQAIVAGYAQAAVDLALRGADGTDTERDARRFHAWLTTTARRWLIVVDDLTSPADLKELWPPIRATGRTVVTTRRREAAIGGSGVKLIPVDVFTPSEASEYLLTCLAAHAALADDVGGIAADLGYLPLALSQAAAFLIDEDIPCSEYRQWFADRRRHLDDLVPRSNELPDDYARTVAATLSLSVEAADRARPAGLATPLLQFASMLDPGGIPASVFTTSAARSWVAGTQGVVKSGAHDVEVSTIRSGLRCLHRLNLLTDADSVTLHALVQRVAREELADDCIADLAQAACDALREMWPDVELDTGLARTLRANAAAVYAHGRNALLAPEIHPVLFQAHHSLGTSGNPAGATHAFEQLFADSQRVLRPDHPDILSARNSIAHWRARAGDPVGAAQAAEQLLADQQRVLGPNHPDTLTTRNNLAGFRGMAGDTKGAVRALEQLLSERLRLLGPDHLDTLTSRNDLAQMLGEGGNPSGAADAFNALLGDLVRVLGPDHSYTLITRSNLARFRGSAGDPAGAAEAFEQLLADQLRVLGPDDPYTLATRANAATWRGESGEAAAAAQAFQEVLADDLRVLGPDHPHTLTARANLAYWRGQAGDPAGVIEDFEELLTDRLRILGPDHPDTLGTRNNLARFRCDAGDLASGAEAFEQLLADQLRVLGPDHPDTLTTRNNLATARSEGGDCAGAVQATEQILADQLRLLGPEHPHTLGSRHNLAVFRGQAGDPVAAARAFEQLLPDMTRVLGPEHPFTLATHEKLSFWQSHVSDTAGGHSEDPGSHERN